MSERRAPVLVAIDGPSGVGKSTAARGLARRLDIPYVDTGSMYRAIALACLRAGVDLDCGAAVKAALPSVDLRVDCVDGKLRLLLGGSVVGDEIRTAEVSQATSRVSIHGPVRERLVEIQRDFGRRYGGVFEGRDIGTVVFPDAEHKFFLVASPLVRARRRHEELVLRGESVGLDELERQMRERDQRDQSRELSPLRSDGSYERLVTDGLEVDEVIERLAELVESPRGLRRSQ